jgi:hypothetical protein
MIGALLKPTLTAVPSLFYESGVRTTNMATRTKREERSDSGVWYFAVRSWFHSLRIVQTERAFGIAIGDAE